MAMAPWAKLKMPDVLYVRTRPDAAMPYTPPTTIPKTVYSNSFCIRSDHWRGDRGRPARWPPPSSRVPQPCGFSSLPVRNLVAMRSGPSGVAMALPDSLNTYLSLQSRSPRFFGKNCEYVVLVSLSSKPQLGGWLAPGSAGECNPPPVHLCTLARPLIMHCRVSVEPQPLATLAPRRNEDAVCSPSWSGSPPV